MGMTAPRPGEYVDSLARLCWHTFHVRGFVQVPVDDEQLIAARDILSLCEEHGLYKDELWIAGQVCTILGRWAVFHEIADDVEQGSAWAASLLRQSRMLS